MKKIGLISLLALLVGIIIIGCGGNSKQDPIPPIPTNGYLLTNVTTPFDIGFAGQEKDFHVQLLKDGLPSTGEAIKVAGLPSEYGFVTPAVATTDDSGYAQFHYKASDPLTNGLYQLALIHNDEENLTTYTYLDINVQEGSLPFDYKFINETTPVIISRSGETKVISAELVDSENNPVVDKTVSITPPETGYGSIDPRSTVSNFYGGVFFNYTAPSDLRGLTSTSLVMSFTEHGNTITQNIDILFERIEYRFENPSTPILISQAGQKEQISVYLMDENNEPVGGKTVSATALDRRYGTLDALQDITDFGSGIAIFDYTAPDDIRGLGSTTVALSFTDEFDHTIIQNIEIRFNDTNNYKLINARNPYDILSATGPTEFDIQLTNNGLPVIDPRPCTTDTSTVSVDCVMPYSIDRSFGRFQGIDTSGDQSRSDGYVYYEYLAPAPGDKASNGEETTFTVIYIDKNGITVAESESILLRMRY